MPSLIFFFFAYFIISTYFLYMTKHFAYCTLSTMCSMMYACLTFNGKLEASFLKVNATFTKAKLFQVLSQSLFYQLLKLT